MLEATFHHYYGVDLSKLLYTESFRWFETRLAYLLADRVNPYAQKIFPPPPTPEPAPLEL